jgi:putative DNA methylase
MTEVTTRRKKLIEVSIPLEAINKASAKEKSIRHGHPSTLHLWWARRPLAACRAVLFAQLVDDPSSWPGRFRTEEERKRERERLHKIIEAMVPWEASTNEHILNNARWEIARSVAWGLGEEPPEKSNSAAVLAYLQEKAPPVYDPFCGGGSIPLEAQRLGLRAYGSDLNPVAVLISKALVEMPPKFAGLPPVNPSRDPHRAWKGAEGLADDVRYYGQWMRDEAEKRIGHLYPKARLPDGSQATVIAWLWARTVASPDPMAKGAHVPLVSSFMLSTKKDKQAWVEVVRDAAAPDGWRFEVRTGKLSSQEEAAKKLGTKAGKAQDFLCVLTGTPIQRSYIQAEGKADRLSERLMAIVADGPRGRAYLAPSEHHEDIAVSVKNSPEVQEARETFLNGATPTRAMITGGVCSAYGLRTWGHLFSARQLTALLAFSDLVAGVRERVLKDMADDCSVTANGSLDGVTYADVIATYSALSVDKAADYWSSLCGWHSSKELIRNTFGRQALPMVWDFAETNPLSKSAGNWSGGIEWVEKVLKLSFSPTVGKIYAIDAPKNNYPVRPVVVSTDPPYYDNIGYSELSDFFYVWLRRSLRTVWPELFRRLLTPKEDELVATPFRHGSQKAADRFFMDGMSKALSAMHDAAASEIPVTIYYAFKQSEAAKEGLTSAGWATFLQAVVNAGYAIDGTWPIRTELGNRMIGMGANALASSIVLVCTKRLPSAAVTTRREFIARLKREMPDALQKIKEAGVGPVDMAQSALGPGMGIFTGYAKVLEPDDSEMTVRTAIALINEVREEILGEEDAGYDPATRFCIDWFQAFGMEAGKSGDAIGMANAYNLGLADLEQAGVFYAKGGVARLLKRAEMRADWRPSNDRQIIHWECAQHLIRALEGEDGSTAVAAGLVAEMSPEDAEAARALAYRLYDICEKKGWAQEAQVYNLLAEEFPHLEQAALDHQATAGPKEPQFDFGEARR